MRVHYEFDTVLPPKGVISALTDFSERRPMWWPNLDPDKFRVHEFGDTHTVVTEGNRRPNVWARERYDWSTPGRVSWTVEESNFCKPGSGIAATISEASNGGSHVIIDWQRSPSNLMGYVAAVAVRVGKDRALGFKAALDHMSR